MDHLPSEEEREWLLGRLADLIANRGYEPFVTAPILEPSDQYFPDEFSRDGRGVYMLARRLMTYAGLGELDVHVDLFSDGSIEAARAGRFGGLHHRGTAAWFAGIQDGSCLFGANVALLRDVQRLPAAMAHEVAHAFRAKSGIQATDVAEEERLTDLTTIYLGFGVLTTNASYQYRSSGELMGAYAVTRWTHQSLGYLPPEAMSFLLAVQATARGLGSKEQRRIASQLEPNQAAYFRSSARYLARMGDGLTERLSIPPSEAWPPSPVLADLLRPIENVPQAGAFDALRPPPEPDPRRANAGRKIFRVKATRAVNRGLLGALALVPLAVIAARVLHSALPALLLPVGFLVGILRGRSIRADYCSDPRCTWRIGADDALCPGCGGTVAGEIASERDRFEAEENLRRLERSREKGVQTQPEE